MRVHYAKNLTAIQYTGEDERKVRELLTVPLKTVSKGDILIVPLKTGKFLSREGKPFEIIDLEETLKEESPVLTQIIGEAEASIAALKESNFELEEQVKVLEDEKSDYENRIDAETKEIKEEVERRTRKATTRKTTTATATASKS